MGTLYRDQGDLGWARLLHKQALAIREKALGKTHPDTISSLHELGVVCLLLGDLDSAQPLLRLAVQQRRAALPKNHPDTLASRFCLALTRAGSNGSFVDAAILGAILNEVERNFQAYSAIQSASQRRAALQRWRGDLDLYLSVCPIIEECFSEMSQAVLDWRRAVRFDIELARMTTDQQSLSRKKIVLAELAVLTDSARSFRRIEWLRKVGNWKPPSRDQQPCRDRPDQTA